MGQYSQFFSLCSLIFNWVIALCLLSVMADLMCTKVHLPCCRCGCPSIANYSVTDLLVLEYSAVHHYCPSQCEQCLKFVDASSTATVLYQSITHEETLAFSDFRMRVANHSLLGSRIYQLPLSFETNGYIAHGHRLVQFVLQTPVVLQSFMHISILQVYLLSATLLFCHSVKPTFLVFG